MKKLRFLPATLLLIALGLAGCGDTPASSQPQSNPESQPAESQPAESQPAETSSEAAPVSESSEAEQSVIKSLEATQENVDIKLGEATSVSAYYKLTGYKTLSSKEKKVTITSSDPAVVKVTGSLMTGLTAGGTATITITSQADQNKSCSFLVNVKDIFFNRSYSEINAANDLSKELPADGGIVVTTGGTSDMLVFNQAPSTSFMTSVKIAVNSVSQGELWPKFGMVYKQLEDDEVTTTYLIVFLDGPMNRVSEGVANWTDFGYCEIGGGVFGWDGNPAYERHQENVFIKSTGIHYDEFFTLTTVVQGRKVHVFLGYGEGEDAKEVYMFTVEGYADLYGEGEGRGFIPGFFQFNSVVTYKDYSYTTDADAIAAQMEGVTERLADYSGGGHDGISYQEA